MSPDVPQPAGLLYNPKPLTFQLVPPGVLHVTMTPATLAVKGGTIGREMGGKFGLKVASYRYFKGFFLHAANLRHGTGRLLLLLPLRGKGC
jgi:hypothetical protein